MELQCVDMPPSALVEYIFYPGFPTNAKEDEDVQTYQKT